MKKYFLLFLIFCFLAILFLFSKKENSPFFSSKNNFVKIDQQKFVLNENPFYPITLNYVAGIQTNGKEVWACPSKAYCQSKEEFHFSKDSVLTKLKGDMELIKEMGFNSIRIVGIGEEGVNLESGELSFGAALNLDRDTVFDLKSEDDYNKYFSVLEEFFTIINDAGLKIIFLVRLKPEIKSTENHFEKLCKKFKNNDAILAFDFFNEPLYFDSQERKKEEVISIVKRWNTIQKKEAPNHLSTIGLVGIREIFEWDPNIIPVDFISFHPYDAEKNQVLNEIYWYKQVLNKPWIIGETGLSADNDSVKYTEQVAFANITLSQALNCGAIGYSWWQFKDVDWKNFHANYLGVIENSGRTITKKSKIAISGTPKPVAAVFQNYSVPTQNEKKCQCLSNYYNLSQHFKYKIEGQLVSEQNQPIANGVVLAWDQYWVTSYHTITKNDGTFELYSNFPFYHWIASASYMSAQRGEIDPGQFKLNSNKSCSILPIGKVYLKNVLLN